MGKQETAIDGSVFIPSACGGERQTPHTEQSKPGVKAWSGTKGMGKQYTIVGPQEKAWSRAPGESIEQQARDLGSGGEAYLALSRS